jgi:hypothetical protein
MGIMGLLYLVGHFFQKVDEGGHREGYGFAVGALLIILAIFVVEKQQMLLALMLTYFYARKQWSTYSKRNLWMICIVDMVIAWLYTYAIIIEPINDYTSFLLTEIWIRPTITYGLVVCFVTEPESDS